LAGDARIPFQTKENAINIAAAITPPTAIAISPRLTIDIASSPLFEGAAISTLIFLHGDERISVDVAQPRVIRCLSLAHNYLLKESNKKAEAA
jgi:hypothetical protein